MEYLGMAILSYRHTIVYSGNPMQRWFLRWWSEIYAYQESSKSLTGMESCVIKDKFSKIWDQVQENNYHPSICKQPRWGWEGRFLILPTDSCQRCTKTRYPSSNRRPDFVSLLSGSCQFSSSLMSVLYTKCSLVFLPFAVSVNSTLGVLVLNAPPLLFAEACCAFPLLALYPTLFWLHVFTFFLGCTESVLNCRWKNYHGELWSNRVFFISSIASGFHNTFVVFIKVLWSLLCS